MDNNSLFERGFKFYTYFDDLCYSNLTDYFHEVCNFRKQIEKRFNEVYKLSNYAKEDILDRYEEIVDLKHLIENTNNLTFEEKYLLTLTTDYSYFDYSSDWSSKHIITPGNTFSIINKLIQNKKFKQYVLKKYKDLDVKIFSQYDPNNNGIYEYFVQKYLLKFDSIYIVDDNGDKTQPDLFLLLTNEDEENIPFTRHELEVIYDELPQVKYKDKRYSEKAISTTNALVEIDFSKNLNELIDEITNLKNDYDNNFLKMPSSFFNQTNTKENNFFKTRSRKFADMLFIYDYWTIQSEKGISANNIKSEIQIELNIFHGSKVLNPNTKHKKGKKYILTDNNTIQGCKEKGLSLTFKDYMSKTQIENYYNEIFQIIMNK